MALYETALQLSIFLLFISNYVFSSFVIEYEWTHANFTWKSPSQYSKAIQEGKYIPKNVLIAQLKIFQDNIFVTLPKTLPGVPVTLAYFNKNSRNKVNIPLTPYPNWEINDEVKCSNLQSALTMEIDKNGIMWVVDGLRTARNQMCPCKLVCLDLKNNGKIIHSYTFPENIAKKSGSYLTGIVIDETDGGYAYITDTSFSDPGLIIFSKQKNKSWKLRHDSMKAESNFPVFEVGGEKIKPKLNIVGIALTPITDLSERTVFYSPLYGNKLYSISNTILKNQTQCNKNLKKSIRFVGRKQGPSDGLIIDDGDNLFYTLLIQNGIGKWNINTPFSSSKIIFRKNNMVWPDWFAIDNLERNLYVVSNNIQKFVLSPEKLDANEKKFRIWRYHNGRKSYICTGAGVETSPLCSENKLEFRINSLDCKYIDKTIKCE